MATKPILPHAVVDQYILAQLAVGPVGLREMGRAGDIPYHALQRGLLRLERAEIVHRRVRHDGQSHPTLWFIGAAETPNAEARRDYAIERYEIAPGHQVVRFGGRWKPRRAQTSRSGPRRAECSLGSIYE